MIYVLTAHFKTPKWIDIQRRYLDLHVHEPFKVIGSFERITDAYDDRFDRVIRSFGSHEGKLNLLAAEVAAEADPDDILMFLDGDAFPVADPMPAVHKALETTSLLAVRRDEQGDKQPHPCFCAVTVAEWLRLGGDWSPGYAWVDSSGNATTDVGGNLLAALERTGTSWTPLVRSNHRNFHPVWFAVYGDIVYHHGAGFRRPMARVDMESKPAPMQGIRTPVLGRWIARMSERREEAWEESTMRTNEMLGDKWYAALCENPKFYLELADPSQSRDNVRFEPLPAVSRRRYGRAAAL